MSFIDKYYAIFNNSVGQHSVTINRAEFANLLGVFSKQEEELNQLKTENQHLVEKEEEARHYLEEVEKFKNYISEIKSLCYQQDLNEDFFACEVLQKISEVEE